MFKCTPIVALCAAFGLFTAAHAQDVTADTVVATVNGTDITVGHMIVLRDALPDQYKNLPAKVLFDGILDQLVQQTVLAQSFDGLVKAIDLRLENEERSLRAGAAISEAVDERVTDAALNALYQERFSAITPETEYNASHILVETEDEAKAIIDELNGGADFATLAQEKSTGPSGPNGGGLGWFSKGMMVAPFEAAVMDMEVGAISAAPVQTQFGWHVIRLNETRLKDAPAFDDVRDQLLDELRQKAVEDVVTDLSANADIVREDTSGIDPEILSDTSLVDQ